MCPFYLKFPCLENFLHLGCTKENFFFVFILNFFSKNEDSYKKLIINADFILCALINQNSWKSALLFLLNLILMFFNLCILIFYNAYPCRYFVYFEFRQKVYFWPHLLFGAQNFRKYWNAVLCSYYDGKVLISDRWRTYKPKFKKCVFSIFLKVYFDW